MASYWVVVRSDRTELLKALSAAFHRHEGFTVIEDRRKDPMRHKAGDGTDEPPAWNGDDFFVVERGSLVE